MAQNNNDPGIESGYDDADDGGTNSDTGQSGTINNDWWHPDNDGAVQHWTDNDGGRHSFVVDDDHW